MASQVFLSLLMTRFSSMRSLSFRGLMLMSAMVYPSRSESRMGLMSEKSSMVYGLTVICVEPWSCPTSPISTYSCSDSSASSAAGLKLKVFDILLMIFLIRSPPRGLFPFWRLGSHYLNVSLGGALEKTWRNGGRIAENTRHARQDRKSVV